jgi:hypothetical protein
MQGSSRRRIAWIVLSFACKAESDGDVAATEADDGVLESSGVATSDDDTSDVPTSFASSDDDGAETDASIICGTDRICVSQPPEGWTGPVVVHVGDVGGTQPDCVAPYPDAAPMLLEGYGDPGPASCDCACELSLASCTSYCYSHSDAGCTQYGEFLQITADCHPFDVVAAATFYMYAMGVPTCQAVVAEEIPAPTWQAQVTTCKPEGFGEPCENDGVCAQKVPAGFAESLCIYMEGENECPPGDFATPYLRYTGVEDDRDCSFCSCGMAEATCTGELDVFASNDCTGAPVASIANNACAATSGASVAVDFTGASSCPVETPTAPEGSIRPVGAVTYCCQG